LFIDRLSNLSSAVEFSAFQPYLGQSWIQVHNARNLNSQRVAMPLLIIFVAIPIIEITLFVKVGGWLGIWPTLAIVLGTAFLGTQLLRRQGVAALARLQESVGKGESPMGPIAHGALILVAGVLLVTPGFFTDALGFLLLAPPVRDMVIRWGAARLVGSSVVFNAGTTHPPKDGGAVEGDFVVLDDEPDDARGQSGATKLD
jgi:UPF0716 protein FxsA